MSVLAKFKKYPNEEQDFDINFADWLEGLGDNDNAVSHEVRDLPDGIVLLASNLNTQTNVVKVWITGGTPDEVYPIVAAITTVAGRVKEAEISVRVLPYAEIQYVEV